MANGYGNGSIIQLDKGKDGKKPKNKCRKWRLVVSLGRDPRSPQLPKAADAEEEPKAGGVEGNEGAEAKPKAKKPKRKYRQKAMNFEGTYTEAQAALREFREKIENGEVVTKTKWTFDEYADHYVTTRFAAGEIQERSATTMRNSLRQIGYLIGGLNMQEVTPQVVEQAYIDLRNGQSRSGKCLSGRTLYNINLCCFLMFEDAKEKGVVGENPLLSVTRPKKDTKEKRALSAEAYRKLLSEIDPTERMECAVLLCAALGLRRSESIAVSWGDVDFEAGTIDVHTSCDERGELKSTKTEAGSRILPMSPKLAESLLERKRVQAVDFAKNAPDLVTEVEGKGGEFPAGTVEVDGKRYDLAPELSVTADEFGRRCVPGSFSTWWRNHSKDLGMQGWTLHELRHSFLSLAAASGVHPAIMQQLAGHRSAQTTMDIYTHVNMDSKRAAVMAMQDAFME